MSNIVEANKFIETETRLQSHYSQQKLHLVGILWLCRIKIVKRRIRFFEKASRASFFCGFSLSLLFDISDHMFQSHK